MKIGTDITVVSRIEKSIEKFGDKFLNRFLNQDEKEIAKKVETIAGFWAGKEAVAKALGCGIGKELSFHDIIIYKEKKKCSKFETYTKSSKKSENNRLFTIYCP